MLCCFGDHTTGVKHMIHHEKPISISCMMTHDTEIEYFNCCKYIAHEA